MGKCAWLRVLCGVMVALSATSCSDGESPDLGDQSPWDAEGETVTFDDLSLTDLVETQDVAEKTWTCNGFGGPGCPCEGDSDCNSGYCIDTPNDGRICTEACSEVCPANFACVAAPGQDLIYVTVFHGVEVPGMDLDGVFPARD